MKPWMKAFWAGALIDAACRSLYQDAIGKEAFLRVVDANWISGWYTVPLALVFLCVGVKLLYDAIVAGVTTCQIFINGAKIEETGKDLNISVSNSIPAGFGKILND